MDIEKIISQLTLEEKASLLSGADFWRTKKVERLGIPSVMVCDGPHGLRKQRGGDHDEGANESIKAVCFPAECAAAASFDRDLVRKIGEAIGDACRHEEISVILGPAVNIKRSPLCGRNFEYYSEDPYLAGEMAVSFIKGVQSRNVGTSIKHFAANSQEHRRMSTDVRADERTLREIYFPVFEKAVKEAQPWTVMCSYNRINGEYASQNRWLLTDVLRNDWGFEGFVMSDWGAVSDRVKGVAAGLDLEMPSSSGKNDRRIVEAVRAGSLDVRLVDESVRRILRIIDRYIRNRRSDTGWDKEAQHQLAAASAAECMVLLKNEDNILPFSSEEKIAVIGEFAKKARFQGGGSSHINSFKVENLLDVLDNESYIYAQGYRTDTEETDEELLLEAVTAAKAADKVLIVAGLPDSFESEGYDRSHMRMPACQNELISKVTEANANTVIVLYNGSPVEMPWADKAKGIVEGYLGGQAVGRATRDVLWGKVNPGGRLPESIPYRLEDNSSYLSYGGEGNRGVYAEGIFVGYRYYDRKNAAVRYPFGYGLSYTTFSFTNLKLGADRIDDTQTLAVSVDVTNTGVRPGKEVVQLYVGAPSGKVFRPVNELKAFEKVSLEPGETKTVTMTLDKRSFAFWDEGLHDWYVPSGVYSIRVGKSSRDILLAGEVEVVSTVPAFREKLTPDTIFMDVMDDPALSGKLQPIIKAGMDAFSTAENEEVSEVAREAITDEMNQAMIRYLPLRGVVTFGDSDITYDDIVKTVAGKTDKIKEIEGELREIRRYLHAHAELSFEEYETTEYLVKKLEAMPNVRIERPTKTGVAAVIRGRYPGRTIAFRADIDALPIQEETDVPFRSVHDGVMHACGHDGHAAMQLMAVKLLAQEADDLHGEVRFLFQHAEEKLPGGAVQLAEAGVMDGVDELYGLHLSSSYPTGKFGVREGALTSATDRFEITITGSEGHSAFPELCVDPVVTAAEVVLALQTIASRKTAAADPVVVSVCEIHGGRAYNVIPESVTIAGATRTFKEETRQELPQLMEKIAKGICDAHGASCTVSFRWGYASVVNDPVLTKQSRRLIEEVFGSDSTFDIGLLMPGEDFSALQKNCPAFFVELGAGSAEGCSIPHHNRNYRLDEDALKFGVEYIYRQAKDRLK